MRHLDSKNVPGNQSASNDIVATAEASPLLTAPVPAAPRGDTTDHGRVRLGGMSPSF